MALGPAVGTVLDGGSGLSDPATLAHATSQTRSGSTRLTADLKLDLPVDSPNGQYTGAITVSLFPPD